MQSASDMLLVGDRKREPPIYFRQLRDMKFSLDISGSTPLQLSGMLKFVAGPLPVPTPVPVMHR